MGQVFCSKISLNLELHLLEGSIFIKIKMKKHEFFENLEQIRAYFRAFLKKVKNLLKIELSKRVLLFFSLL